MKLIRKKHRSWLLALGFAAAMALFTGIFSAAHAALYNASGLLGQIDSHGNPLWTSTGANDQGFYGAIATALDPVNHRLFVDDVNNTRVLVFSLDDNDHITSRAASYVIGQVDFGSRIASTSQNTFDNGNGSQDPNGLAYDSVNARLFVVDSDNNRVLVFDASPSTIHDGENATYVLGQPDFTSSNSTTTRNGLDYPSGGITYDLAASRLFVADSSNNRVLAFDAATSTIHNGENAEAVIGQTDFNSNPGETTTSSTLAFPDGLAYDGTSHRLFVAEGDNNRVTVFDAATSTIANGESALNVLGQQGFTSGNSTTTQVGLNVPETLDYDSAASRLFVTDSDNSRVLVFNVATSTITNGEDAQNVIGQSGFVSSGKSVNQSGFDFPNGVTYDPTNGQLFVSDGYYNNNRVMVFDAGTSTISNGEEAINELGHTDQNGDPVYTAGGPNNTPSPSSALAITVALDSTNHRLFVADRGGNRVLLFALDSNNNITNTAASYVLGQPDFFSSSATTTASGFGQLFQIAYDPVGLRLFAVDGNNNRILVFDVNPGTLHNGENAENVLGQTSFTSGDATSSLNGFNLPFGVAYDASSSRLFVSDYTNSRALVFNVGTSTITNGESASHVIYAGQLASPNDIEYDAPNSRLIVTDSSHNRVLFFDSATSTISDGESPENVLGQPDLSSTAASTTQSGLSHPVAAAFDTLYSRLFVTDYGNHRVLLFDAATSTITNGEPALNVLGQPDFVTANSGTTQNEFDSSVFGSAYDPSNNRLFVGDGNNNRLLAFTFITIITPSLPSGVVGSSYSQTINTTSSQGVVGFTLVSGALPPGLSLSTSTGVISGTPMIATTANFAVEADDAFATGNFFDRKTYTITVNAPAPPPAVTVSVSSAYGAPYISGIGIIASSTQSETMTSSSATLTASSTNLQAQLVSLKAELATLLARAGETGSSSAINPFTRNLSLGMAGNDVKALQLFLITQASGPAAARLKAHGATKTFGPLTFNALKEFQKKAGITPASGYFGPLTRRSIDH